MKKYTQPKLVPLGLLRKITKLTSSADDPSSFPPGDACITSFGGSGSSTISSFGQKSDPSQIF